MSDNTHKIPDYETLREDLAIAIKAGAAMTKNETPYKILIENCSVAVHITDVESVKPYYNGSRIALKSGTLLILDIPTTQVWDKLLPDIDIQVQAILKRHEAICNDKNTANNE